MRYIMLLALLLGAVQFVQAEDKNKNKKESKKEKKDEWKIAEEFISNGILIRSQVKFTERAHKRLDALLAALPEAAVAWGKKEKLSYSGQMPTKIVFVKNALAIKFGPGFGEFTALRGLCKNQTVYVGYVEKDDISEDILMHELCHSLFPDPAGTFDNRWHYKCWYFEWDMQKLWRKICKENK